MMRGRQAGMRANSTDLRECIVRLVAEGRPVREAARRFGVSASAVRRYVAEVLGPTLRPRQVVVLDNLSVHKAASIRHAIAARHCTLLFLPPYSPDFTPIEQAFSKIKAILRQIGARTKEALWEAMRVAVEAITSEDALAWFAHAGYTLHAQAT